MLKKNFCWSALTCSLAAVIFCSNSKAGENVTVAWDPSPSTNVAGYRVHYGLAPQTYSAFVQAGAQASQATVSNLQAGQRYYFAVKAFAASGGVESAFSEEVSHTVSSGTIGTKTFSNPQSISIPGQGAATPYASVINASGLAGQISKVTVTLHGITHTRPDDLDVLLVGPAGQKVLLLSDAGGGTDLNNVTLTFSDSASASLPNSARINAGTFRPSNYGTSDAFSSPAPGAPYATTLSAFNGSAANGNWSLYVFDDASNNSGGIAGGWSLAVTTAEQKSLEAFSAEPLAKAVSAPAEGVQIHITANPKGEVVLRIEGVPSEEYTIEASDDLRTWNPIGTVSDRSGVSSFTDTDSAARGARFYRVAAKGFQE